MISCGELKCTLLVLKRAYQILCDQTTLTFKDPIGLKLKLSNTTTITPNLVISPFCPFEMLFDVCLQAELVSPSRL